MLMATSLPGGTQPLSSTVMSGHKTPSLCLTRHGRRAAERAPAGHDGDVASENCAKWLLSYLLAVFCRLCGRERQAVKTRCWGPHGEPNSAGQIPGNHRPHWGMVIGRPTCLRGDALRVFFFLMMQTHTRKLNKHHAPRAQASLGLSEASSFACGAFWFRSRWLLGSAFPNRLFIPFPSIKNCMWHPYRLDSIWD